MRETKDLGVWPAVGKKPQLSETRQQKENNDKDAGDDRENNTTSDELGKR